MCLDFIRFSHRRRGKFQRLPHLMLLLLVGDAVSMDLWCWWCLFSCPASTAARDGKSTPPAYVVVDDKNRISNWFVGDLTWIECAKCNLIQYLGQAWQIASRVESTKGYFGDNSRSVIFWKEAIRIFWSSTAWIYCRYLAAVHGYQKLPRSFVLWEIIIVDMFYSLWYLPGNEKLNHGVLLWQVVTPPNADFILRWIAL